MQMRRAVVIRIPMRSPVHCSKAEYERKNENRKTRFKDQESYCLEHRNTSNKKYKRAVISNGDFMIRMTKMRVTVIENTIRKEMPLQEHPIQQQNTQNTLCTRLTTKRRFYFASTIISWGSMQFNSSIFISMILLNLKTLLFYIKSCS